MGCAETSVMPLPDNYHQDARDALGHPSLTACGPHRSLAVVPSIAIEGTTARLRRDSGSTPAGMNRLLAIAHWFSAAGVAARPSLIRHERNAKPPGQCRGQALFQHGHNVRPVRRMDVAAVIAVDRQPGRTGPPLGHEE